MKFLKLFLSLGILLLSFDSVSIAESTQNFEKAKRLASALVFTGKYQTDIYCGCKYANKRMDWASCGYKPRHSAFRGARLEWEHVVPAFYLYRSLPCHYRGGRTYCVRTSDEFRRREGDLHNLRPSVGELNEDRSDKLYGPVPRESKYGQCNFSTNKILTDPPENVHGDVARITLYMNDKYNLDLPSDYIELMKRWSEQDPVNDDEREINKRIFRIQGDSNPYVEQL